MAKTRRATDDDVRRRPDDEDDEPRRARRRDDDEDDEGGGDDEPRALRKKRKSAAGPTKLVLRICGGVALAAAIIVLLIWVYSPVGTDSSLTCYLPPETTSISGYDVEEGTKIVGMKEVHDLLLNNYRQFSERRFSTDCGVTDKDVARYLSGVASSKNPEEDLQPQDRRGSITVIKFKRDVDTAKFINSFTGQYQAVEAAGRDGKKYHQLLHKVWVKDHFESEPDISFFFPNNRTLVYTSTRKECEEALTRQPGKVALEGDMRELASKVDGHYFQASTGWYERNGVSNTIAFGLGFVDADVRDQKSYAGRTGTGMWFADNGNDFLFASGALYSDIRTARTVRNALSASFLKAQADIFQSEAGRPGGLDDPFNPPKAAGQPAPGGFGGGGGGGATNEQSKDILEALSAYARTARVYNRGRLVVVEGTIPHGTPEQGVFEKFWKVIAQRFQFQSQGFPGGFGGPPGFQGGGFGPPPGMPMGPGVPGGPAGPGPRGGPPPGPGR